ncbi:MAG TPA: outer membrane lipoprotein chaperone LolA [Nevskiaceae bacterium]|nr:outer membrane lipoprotein chaperone LolA [Nevskiaceae bacterium]
MKPAIALLSIVFAPLAFAESADEALKRFVEGAQTISAGFDQVQRDEGGKTVETTSGHMWIARPSSGARGAGKFRWSYEKPYQQLMVCDGDKIWMYDPDLAQVTVRPAAAALAGTPAQLLSRRATLGDEFTLEDGGVKGDVHIVRLKPKASDSDFKSIELSLRGSAPVQMLFRDQLGGTSTVRFSDIQVNGKVDDAQFRFKPPKGVEVVEAEGAPRQ